MLSNIDEADNLARMERGELYYAFSPKLVAARKRCGGIVSRLNRAEELTRRELAEYWKEYVDDITYSFLQSSRASIKSPQGKGY